MPGSVLSVVFIFSTNIDTSSVYARVLGISNQDRPKKKKKKSLAAWILHVNGEERQTMNLRCKHKSSSGVTRGMGKKVGWGGMVGSVVNRASREASASGSDVGAKTGKR